MSANSGNLGGSDFGQAAGGGQFSGRAVQGCTMGEGKPRYRHELKYLINYGEKEILADKLRKIASIDPHATGGEYLVRSLYFDDLWNSSYEEKLMGIPSRRKYRIRIYNCSDSHIALECKEKRNEYIYKFSIPLTRRETDDIIGGRYEFLKDKKDELSQEFYMLLRSGMHPDVIVDYDRIPFVYESGTVRITFDMHVRAAFNGYDIFDPGLPVYNAMQIPDTLIMEVKFTEFLPDIFQDIVIPRAAAEISSSKYVMCSNVRRDIYGMEIIR